MRNSKNFFNKIQKQWGRFIVLKDYEDEMELIGYDSFVNEANSKFIDFSKIISHLLSKLLYYDPNTFNLKPITMFSWFKIYLIYI